MRFRTRSRAVAIAVLSLAVGAMAVGAESTALQSTRGLLERMRRAGRAETDVSMTRPDPVSGGTRTVHGRLALELPHFARLDLPETGERLTLREDGGDWLQPQAHQLVRGGPRSAGAALQWWGVLLEARSERFDERPLGARGYALAPRGSAAPDTQIVWLSGAGLPARIEVVTGSGERSSIRLGAWRFTHPRGARGFTLAAPTGYEVIALP